MTRVLGYIWLLPITLVGLLAALLGGCRPYDLNGCAVVFVPLRRWSLWRFLFFGRFSFSAITIGAIQVYRNEIEASAKLCRRHELQHVYQAMAWGPFWPIAYYLGVGIRMGRRRKQVPRQLLRARRAIA